MRFARSVLGVAVALALVASTASADLVTEIKVGDGTYAAPASYGGQLVVTPGQTIGVELWSVITGGFGSTFTDLLDTAVMRVFSSNGGATLVNFTAGAMAYPIGASTTGSQLGMATDLDGDGDLDWGGPPQVSWLTSLLDPAVSERWIVCRNPGGFYFAGAPPGAKMDGGGHVAVPNATFDILLDANPGDWGTTEIWVQPDYLTAGAYKWYEGSTLHTSPGTAGDPLVGVTSGTPLVLVMTATAAAPGGGAVVEILNDGLPVLLDGSASTGSINYWAWKVDLDGNGDYELVIGEEDGTSDGMLEVTFDMLATLGLLPNTVYNALLYVDWNESAPVTLSESGFQIEIVPEPATLALLGLGALALVRRKR